MSAPPRAVEIPLGTPLGTGSTTNPINNSTTRDHSDDGTLAEDEKAFKSSHHLKTGDSELKRSAHSSMDHVADLGGRVSVRKGKEEFAALERRFSNLSQHSQELKRSNTRRSARSGLGGPVEKTKTNATNGDVEKAQEEEEFDLAGVLKSSQSKADEAGIKQKRIGVAWENLEVVGGGGLKINIRNFSSAVIEQFLMPVMGVVGLFGYKPFAPKPKSILHPNSGSVKPGEMCLVIGRPGSGCSTFLKAIANQRDTYLAVNGNVEYAGVGWKEMSKLYAG
jgi:ATP-binding cassette subfamily G (WHITE) protein 2 (SNQ2)